MKPSKDNTFCWYPFGQLAPKEWQDGKIHVPYLVVPPEHTK